MAPKKTETVKCASNAGSFGGKIVQVADLIKAQAVVEAARDYYLDTDGESKCDPWTGTCECSAARLGRALGRDEQ